jgi:hypothetical protein
VFAIFLSPDEKNIKDFFLAAEGQLPAPSKLIYYT